MIEGVPTVAGPESEPEAPRETDALKSAQLVCLPARQVLVTVGTPCAMSALGSTDTHRATVTGDKHAIAFAACDAGLVAIDAQHSTAGAPSFMEVGEREGEPISPQEIEARWGSALRDNMGIRRLSRDAVADHLLTDIAAPLPHDLEQGGLRRLAGLTFAEVRRSSLKDMASLFDDDPRLGPSLQSLLFLYGGLGALAALPRPLAQLLPEPHRFLMTAGFTFTGNDSFARLGLGMQPRQEASDGASDRLAYRLAGSLATHGPSLIATMLAPALSLSRVRRRPELLDQLVDPRSPLRRVPQAPLVVSAACASALSALCAAALPMVLSYPGHPAPDLLMWTAADAALQPDARVLEGFGVGGLMSMQKLDEINRARSQEDRRSPAECLAPFDVEDRKSVV